MATTKAELMVRAGMDTSQLERDLDKAKKALDDMSSSSKKSFLKAGSAAEAFKKMLTEISAQSPIVGAALKAAMSPIVGVFAGAMLVFKAVKGHLDEINKVLDTIGQTLGNPVTKVKEALREVNKYVLALMKDEDAWRAKNDSPTDKYVEKLKTRLALIKAEGDTLQTNRRTIKELETALSDMQRMEKAAKKAENTALLEAGLGPRLRMIEKAKSNLQAFGDQKTTIDDVIKKGEYGSGWSKFLEGLTGPVAMSQLPAELRPMITALAGISNTSKVVDIQKMVELSAAYERAINRTQTSLTKLEEEQDKARNKLTDARNEYDKSHSAVKNLNEQLRDAKLHLAQWTAQRLQAAGTRADLEDFKPSIEQVAHSGRFYRNRGTAFEWRWQPGPFARAANMVQQLEAAATESIIWEGKNPRAQALADRAKQIRAWLADAGVLSDPLSKMDSMDRRLEEQGKTMASLLALAKDGDGLKMRPVLGD